MQANTTPVNGLGLAPGTAEGAVEASVEPVSVARIDPASGILKEPGHALHGRCLAGSVLVFPSGKGSSSGSYVLLNLARRGLAPAAMVVSNADAVLIAGAVLAGIPLVSGLDADALRLLGASARLRVDGERGTVS